MSCLVRIYGHTRKYQNEDVPIEEAMYMERRTRDHASG